MRTLAVILLLVAGAAVAQDPETNPALTLTVLRLNPIAVINQRLETIECAIAGLNPEQVESLAGELSRIAEFEGRTIAVLTRHNSGPENYLFAQIRRIRETAKTDPEKAQAMIAAIVEQFKRFGVTL